MPAVKKTVLLVDDSAYVLNHLSGILVNTDFKVIGIAKDGMEAVKKFKELSPDIVALDVTMPKMDGIQTLRIIKSIKKDVKVIMVTSVNRLDKVVECKNAGADHYIVKPFEKEKVLAVFAEL